MTDDRHERNAYAGKRAGGEPLDEAEHFYVCGECGQAVDMRRLGDVFHHEDAGHKPIGVLS
jgi:hypothetical protein